MYTCKFCGRRFESSRQLGGHMVLCKKNPKRQQTLDKQANKKAKKQKYWIHCEVCGQSFEVFIFPSEYQKGFYRKTCSNNCSHKLTVQNTDKISKNKSIQNSINKKISTIPKKYRYCEYCGNKILTERKNSNYCSEECMIKGRHEKLSKSAYLHRFGGLNPNTTHKNYKRGYYKGIWCDSSWELAYLIYMFDHGFKVERNYKAKQYIFENRVYNFYPDFNIDGKLYEIKGFYTPKNKAKKEQVKDVIFLDNKDMKPIIEYVISKYGKDYISLYTR